MNEDWRTSFRDIKVREELKKEVIKASMEEPLRESEKAFVKRIAVMIECVICLVFIVLIGLRGFDTGIWQDSRFYEKTIQDGTRTYTEKSHPTIVISPGCTVGEEVIYPIEVKLNQEQTQGVKLHATLDINGSQITVRIYGEDETMVLSAIYHKKGDLYTMMSEPSGIINTYMDEQTEQRVTISREALCRMILEDDTIRILGDSQMLFISILCFGICLFVNLWGIPVALWLAGFYLQFFYHMEQNMEESELLPVVVYGYGLLHFLMGACILAMILL